MSELPTPYSTQDSLETFAKDVSFVNHFAHGAVRQAEKDRRQRLEEGMNREEIEGAKRSYNTDLMNIYTGAVQNTSRSKEPLLDAQEAFHEGHITKHQYELLESCQGRMTTLPYTPDMREDERSPTAPQQVTVAA